MWPWNAIVNPVPRFIGKVSYSGYVFRFAVVWLMAGIERHCLPEWIARGQNALLSTLVLGIFTVLTVVLSIEVATVNNALIEGSGQAEGHRIVRMMEEPDSALSHFLFAREGTGSPEVANPRDTRHPEPKTRFPPPPDRPKDPIRPAPVPG